MKSRRIPLESEVDKYEVGKGMEDGFELFSDVVTKGWIVSDSLVKIERPDGTIVCPYIKHRRGRTFIGEGDYRSAGRHEECMRRGQSVDTL